MTRMPVRPSVVERSGAGSTESTPGRASTVAREASVLRSTVAPATRDLMCAGVPSTRTRPREMTMTRARPRRPPRRGCGSKRTVLPRSASPRTCSQKVCRASTSRAAVGSSRKSRSGSPQMASAKESRWRWPPESWLTRLERFSVRSARARTSSTGRATGIVVAHEVDRLGDGQALGDVAVLEHRAGPRPGRCRAGSAPKTLTEPAVGWRIPRSSSMVVVLPAPFGPGWRPAPRGESSGRGGRPRRGRRSAW